MFNAKRPLQVRIMDTGLQVFTLGLCIVVIVAAMSVGFIQ